MNDNDMANMIKKAQEMINNNQVPDELKNLVANMQNSTGNTNSNSQTMYNNSNNFNNMNSNQKSNGKQDYNKYSSTYSQRNNNMGNSRQNYNGYNQSNSSSQNNNSRNNNYGNSNSQNNNSSNGNSSFDINKLGDLLKNFQSNSSNQNNTNNGNSGFPDIDIETMMKLQNIMSKMKSANNDDDMSKLLISLKPYLRNEKQEKVDEYIKLIRMGKITQAFDLFGGDKS